MRTIETASAQRSIPRDGRIDSTLAMMRDPYRFISRTCDRLKSDVFRARFLLRSSIFLSGRDAAELFYGSDRFIRAGAAPGPLQKTLLGRGGVQGLDDAEHLYRKCMFLDIMNPDAVEALNERIRAEWLQTLPSWTLERRVSLYDELHSILFRAACDWADVPFCKTEVDKRVRQLTALFDYAGSRGPAHFYSRWARRRADRWGMQIIESIRRRELRPREQSAAHLIAWHRQLDGKLLPSKIAAVELLNILRPIMAVSVFVVFVAHALQVMPLEREKLLAKGPKYEECFVQEIRRSYPFFPASPGIVRDDFHWNGFLFRKGTRALFDIYGTNHDQRIWESPFEFRPERFDDFDGDPFAFIPQGGGHLATGHRCPGESATLEIMKTAVRILTRRMSYDVPPQRLEVDITRMPALPRDRFQIENVRMIPALIPTVPPAHARV